MRLKDMQARALAVFHTAGDRALTLADVLEGLGLQPRDRKKLTKVLSRLVSRGALVADGSDRYRVKTQEGVLRGLIQVARSGTGFVKIEEGGSDVMIPLRKRGRSLPGDRVMVQLDERLKRRDDDLRSGSVLSVIERAAVQLVGTLRRDGRVWIVIPVDQRYGRAFQLHEIGEARPGDRVVVRLRHWEEGGELPLGELTEVIGPADQPTLDTIAIMRHYGFVDEFPLPVMEQAEHAGALMETPGVREDLTDLFIVTIDPLRARDYDDALSLTLDAAGRRVLGVHIADVSHFVPLGSPMDAEALRRGNSVYLPDKVIPMLPEQLSNGVCSLKPDVPRLTYSVFMTVDDDGSVVTQRFCRSIIRSRLRLTYEQALALLKSDTAGGVDGPLGVEARRHLRDLHRLAQQFRQRRFQQCALNIDLPECEVQLGADGLIHSIRTVLNDVSHQLVEECMVAANEAVDREISRRGFPLIHRVHEPPAEERVNQLGDDLRTLGFSPGDLTNRRNLARFLSSIDEDPLAHHIRTMVLRSMSRAVYSARAAGHYGLAKAHYTHFTSPIRRYADLVVHRILTTALTDGRHDYTPALLASVAASCSRTEEMADNAEREIVEIKKYRFLAQQLERHEARVYDGVVVNVAKHTVFVELVELQVVGVLRGGGHVASRAAHGHRARHEAAAGPPIGQRLQVCVTDVDLDARRLGLALASQRRSMAPREVRPSSSRRGGKGPSHDAHFRRHKGPGKQR